LLDRTYSLNNFDPLLVNHFAQYIDLIESNPEQHDTLLQAAGVDAVYNTDGELVPLEQPAVRAWFVESECWHSDEVSLREAMLDPAWQPLRQVHLLGDGPCPVPNLNSTPPGEILTMRRTAMDVHVVRDSWLVLADTYYTSAGVFYDDSHAAPAKRANLTFQAIRIPAGTQTVQFLGNDDSWLLPGALISLVSLLVTLVLFRTKNPLQ